MMVVSVMFWDVLNDVPLALFPMPTFIWLDRRIAIKTLIFLFKAPPGHDTVRITCDSEFPPDLRQLEAQLKRDIRERPFT
jgi:hypothetical protein